MSESTVVREDDSFVDAHGVRIHYYRWRAAQPKAVVQLVHGLGEYAARYEGFAQALAAAGYTALSIEDLELFGSPVYQQDGATELLGDDELARVEGVLLRHMWTGKLPLAYAFVPGPVRPQPAGGGYACGRVAGGVHRHHPEWVVDYVLGDSAR